MEKDLSVRSGERDITGFLWQHLWLLISLFVMTLGVALCVRSALGSSVISTIPFVMTLAGAGIAFEIKCGSVTMPGEGLPAAICKVTGKPFAKIKIIVDVTLVVIAVILGYVYFQRWLWQVVGIGTLFAMVYVGMVVKIITPRIKWFDRLLCYRPGFKRYLYGLARFLNKK